MSICKKCLVSGRVQGVFYRASAQQQAEKLDVTGYAINLAEGPSGSEVNDVICELVEEIPPACFTIA